MSQGSRCILCAATDLITITTENIVMMIIKMIVAMIRVLFPGPSLLLCVQHWCVCDSDRLIHGTSLNGWKKKEKASSVTFHTSAASWLKMKQFVLIV